MKEAILREIDIIKKFNHVNIVKYLDLIETERSIYIVTEFCE